jgi:hypothetical protein
MALRPWVKRLINEVLEFELFDVDNGRRSYVPAPAYRQSLQDVIPQLDQLWRDSQAMQDWVIEKIDEIGEMDIADEEKVEKVLQAMHLAVAAMGKSYGASDIPSLEDIRDMMRPKLAVLGISI